MLLAENLQLAGLGLQMAIWLGQPTLLMGRVPALEALPLVLGLV